jgi:demethylmenaquinone methyltransferase/2-methoxy-6-polyprenyl-1,4-benzoquinol methylase
MNRRLSSGFLPMPADRPSLRDALSAPDSKHKYVRRLFSVIAHRYDLITVLLSYGQDRRWKRRLVAMAPIGPGTEALDLACGTVDIAFELAAGGARVTGLDITLTMLTLARAKRAPGRPVRFAVGDMMALPFADGRFDVVTTGYGIRNVPEIAGAIAEAGRVLRPGGTLLSLDFNRPSNPVVRAVYLAYLTIVGSLLGLVLHRDPDTYRYIPESIRRYPGAAAVADLIRSRGFSECEWYPVLGGLMALHRARK